MALDMMNEVFLYFYEVEHPRRPNQYPDEVVQMRAPLDIYDFIKIIRAQEQEIVELRARFIATDKALAAYRLREAAGPLDNGSEKFIS